jgi:formylglycine-generating enzyme required for sulfatase activity
MHGGVDEWCLDPFKPSHASLDRVSEMDAAPFDRVIRGGNFLSPEVDCRAAARTNAPPETRSFDLGFRVAFDDLATPPNGS